MKVITKEYTESLTFPMFEIGELVLDDWGEVGIVESCEEPMFAEDRDSLVGYRNTAGQHRLASGWRLKLVEAHDTPA